MNGYFLKKKKKVKNWSWPFELEVMSDWAARRHRNPEKLHFRLSSDLLASQNSVEIIAREQKRIWPEHMEIAIKIYSVFEALEKAVINSTATSSI